MYETFFEFRRRPFAAAPQVECYFPGRTVESARQTIERCLTRREGAALVVGPAGTGKSMLCAKLAEHFRDDAAVVKLASGQLTSRRAMLQALLYELGLPYRGLEEGELRLALVDRVTGPGDKRGVLLVVDDAHVLPVRVLEEIRLLSDLTCRGEPRVRLLLSGASLLEERLAAPRLEALQQRITARCYLEAFDRNDAINYVRHQITQVGGDPTQIFTEAALEVLYRATEGIPRLMNQTCDHALVLAYGGGVKPIDAAGIEEAWADLQQLPTPWSQAKGYAAQPVEQSASEVSAPRREIVAPSSSGDSVELIAAAPRAFEPSSAEDDAQQAIGAIETHLAEWESQFHPSAKKEPEVVLTLDNSRRDPFAEDFVAEEVVQDRYASLDRLCVGRPVQAYGSDERLISTLLEMRTDRPDSPKLRCLSEPAVAAAPMVQHAEPAPNCEAPSPHAWFGRESFVEELDVVEPEDQEFSLPTAMAGDADMIIVEPDPQTAATVRPGPAPVRKQDYRQLFVRLRNGT